METSHSQTHNSYHIIIINFIQPCQPSPHPSTKINLRRSPHLPPRLLHIIKCWASSPSTPRPGCQVRFAVIRFATRINRAQSKQPQNQQRSCNSSQDDSGDPSTRDTIRAVGIIARMEEIIHHRRLVNRSLRQFGSGASGGTPHGESMDEGIDLPWQRLEGGGKGRGIEGI